MVNIELKTNIFRYDGLVEKVNDLIQQYDLIDRVVLSSFNTTPWIKPKVEFGLKRRVF